MEYITIQNADDLEKLLAYLRQKKTPTYVTLMEGEPRHTLRQRGYLEALITFMALEHGEGNTRAERDEFRNNLLAEILGRVEEINPEEVVTVVARRSTTTASKKCMSEIIENLLKYAAENNIIIPPPEKLITLAENDPRYDLVRDTPEGKNGN